MGQCNVLTPGWSSESCHAYLAVQEDQDFKICRVYFHLYSSPSSKQDCFRDGKKSLPWKAKSMFFSLNKAYDYLCCNHRLFRFLGANHAVLENLCDYYRVLQWTVSDAVGNSLIWVTCWVWNVILSWSACSAWGQGVSNSVLEEACIQNYSGSFTCACPLISFWC